MFDSNQDTLNTNFDFESNANQDSDTFCSDTPGTRIEASRTSNTPGLLETSETTNDGFDANPVSTEFDGGVFESGTRGFENTTTFATNTNTTPHNLNDFPTQHQQNTTPPHPIASITIDKTFNLTAEDDGKYWTIPSISTILSAQDVCAIPNFILGRKGYGEVRFTDPVDLSQVPSIPLIPGSIVVFDLDFCAVYPDEAMKPPVGSGLNVPAIITLEKCWAVSSETRRPIFDIEDPRFIAYVERLKRQPGTEFIDYIVDTGSWVFKVKNFSSYSRFPRNQNRIEHFGRTGSQTPTLSTSSRSSSPSNTDLDQHNQSDVHVLGSHHKYQHDQHSVSHASELQQAFKEAYIPFSKNLPIPAAALERLLEFTINAEEFIRLVSERELPKSRYIYLKSGKICFDEYTLPPHGSIIMEIGRQISGQDDPFELFEAATGDGTYSCM